GQGTQLGRETRRRTCHEPAKAHGLAGAERGDGSRVAGSDATAGAPATPALDSFVHCHDEYAGGAGMCAIVRPCPARQPGRDEPRCLRYPDPSYNAYGAVAVASRSPDAPTPVCDGTR